MLLWWLAGDAGRISKRAQEELVSDRNRVVISAVVIWEVAIKRRLGKLDAPADLLQQLERAGVDLLPIQPRHADHVGTLPLHHRDPFDRLLIAQAESEGLGIVTADQDLSRYGIKVIW